MKDDRALKVFLYSLSALMITGSACSLFIIVHSWHSLPAALTTTAKIVAAPVLVSGGAIATGGMVLVTMYVVDKIQINYTAQYKVVKRQAPSLFAGAAMIADTWLILADKSFRGDEVKTIMVSLVTFLLFAIAKHIGNKGRWQRIGGWLVWAAGILLLPVAVCVNEGWTPLQLFHHIRGFAIEAQIVIGLSIPVLLLVPFAFESDEKD